MYILDGVSEEIERARMHIPRVVRRRDKESIARFGETEHENFIG